MTSPLSLEELTSQLDAYLAQIESATGPRAVRIVRQIARLGDRALPIITERLQAANSKETAAALAAALLAIDARRGSAYISTGLSAPDVEMRIEALAPLALACNRAAVALAIDAIEKGPAPVAERATGILRDLAAYPGLYVEDALVDHIADRDEPFAVSQALAALGTDAARREIHRLASRSDRSNGQVAALQALIVLGDQADQDVVASAIRGAESRGILKQAAITAGRLRTKRAVPALIEVLENQDPDEASSTTEVTWALGAITGENLKGIPELWLDWWEQVGRLKDWHALP